MCLPADGKKGFPMDAKTRMLCKLAHYRSFFQNDDEKAPKAPFQALNGFHRNLLFQPQYSIGGFYIKVVKIALLWFFERKLGKVNSFFWESALAVYR